MKIAFKHKSTNIYDRLIKLWMRGNYAHCEVILEEHGNNLYTTASSVAGKGVRTVAQTLDPAGWDIIDVPNVDAEAVSSWFKVHDGQGYDYMGIAGFILRPLSTGSSRRWFCSEAIMAALGWPQPWRYDPDTCYDILAPRS